MGGVEAGATAGIVFGGFAAVFLASARSPAFFLLAAASRRLRVHPYRHRYPSPRAIDDIDPVGAARDGIGAGGDGDSVRKHDKVDAGHACIDHFRRVRLVPPEIHTTAALGVPASTSTVAGLAVSGFIAFARLGLQAVIAACSCSSAIGSTARSALVFTSNSAVW